MERLRDSALQFTITTALTLVSLLFTVLTFQSTSLRIGGVVVIMIFIFAIVLINFWPASKASGPQQNVNNTPSPHRDTSPNYYPPNIPPAVSGRNPTPSTPQSNAAPHYAYQGGEYGYPQYGHPQYGYPQAPATSPRSTSRQPRLTPTKRRLLIATLIGWVIYVAALVLMGNSSISSASDTTGTTLLLIGDIILIVAWIIALVNIARLGYWGWFIFTLVLLWFGIFFYIFFVPNTPRKTLSQTSMR